MQEFLQQYGYFALFIGTLLEGETILALGGLAAHQGYLSFPVVVAVAALGGFLGDQMFFWLGARYGDTILRRFPSIAARTPRVKALLKRWDAPVIVVIRFLYGLRIAGPIVIGTAGIARWRVALFNFIGACLWAPLVAGVGYVAGHAMTELLTHVHEVQALVVIAVAMAVGIFYLVRKK